MVPELLSWGAGPRACQYLILGGKARALLHGRLHVTTDDVRAVAYPVLRHRLVTTFNADAEGITTDDVVRKLIQAIPLPQEEAAAKLRRADPSSPRAPRQFGGRRAQPPPVGVPEGNVDLIRPYPGVQDCGDPP